jgi:hypothetical protein
MIEDSKKVETRRKYRGMILVRRKKLMSETKLRRKMLPWSIGVLFIIFKSGYKH